MINPCTKLYAVLGHPVGHSLSPPMHNTAFSVLKLDAVYMAFDVASERLPTMLGALAELGFAGLNLTVPLKEKAFQTLSDFDESALRMRSVNTVRLAPERRWRGYSTDGEGFLKSLREEFGIDVAGRRLCVLGCGGAGRAVAIACAMAGATELLLLNRNQQRAEHLAMELSGLPRPARVNVVPSKPEDWREAAHSADIVIQATSAGLRQDDQVLLGREAFHTGQCFYDLIYHVSETAMMRAAAAAGARTANGLGMLLYQGALALEIWTGRPAPVDDMRRALTGAVYGL